MWFFSFAYMYISLILCFISACWHLSLITSAHIIMYVYLHIPLILSAGSSVHTVKYHLKYLHIVLWDSLFRSFCTCKHCSSYVGLTRFYVYIQPNISLKLLPNPVCLKPPLCLSIGAMLSLQQQVLVWRHVISCCFVVPLDSRQEVLRA